MLTGTVLADTNIVAAIYDGALAAPEVVEVRRELDKVIAEHGKARMLVEYGDIDFGRMEPRAVWEDLKSAGVMRDVEKAAVLTDTRWVRALTEAAGAVTPTDIRVFDARQRAEALAWLRKT